MAWHGGSSLSQTVYTCLYFHEYAELDPVLWRPSPGPDQPSALVTSVLRSWILGTIKTCDMAWREFSQRHVYEVCLSCLPPSPLNKPSKCVIFDSYQNEDIISDKSELSLLESISVDRALASLDTAKNWLLMQEEFPWREDLILRLEQRHVRVCADSTIHDFIFTPYYIVTATSVRVHASFRSDSMEISLDILQPSFVTNTSSP